MAWTDAARAAALEARRRRMKGQAQLANTLAAYWRRQSDRIWAAPHSGGTSAWSENASRANDYLKEARKQAERARRFGLSPAQRSRQAAALRQGRKAGRWPKFGQDWR